MNVLKKATNATSMRNVVTLTAVLCACARAAGQEMEGIAQVIDILMTFHSL